MTEEQKKMATLAGGVEVEVEYRAPHPSPLPPGGEGVRKESVLVRELAVKEYPKLLPALNDEERQVEIFCDKPEGWAATLKAASHEAVMQAGEALNLAPFFGWYERRIKMQRKLQPEEMDRLLAEARKVFQEALRNGSLKLPSNAA